ECNERHDSINKIDAESFHRCRKPHRIFLYTLRGSLNGSELRPMRNVIVVHRGTPAKDVVTDEEFGQHSETYRNQGNFGKTCKLETKLKQRDWSGLRKGCLDEVVKRAVPVVDRYAYLNLEVGS